MFHQTLYRYSAPVTLTTHRLRLTPRPDAGQILSQHIVIEPEPHLVREVADRWGNRITEVEFAGLTSILRIESRFELVTEQPAKPSPSPDLPALPWRATAADDIAAFAAPVDDDPAVRDFAFDLAEASGWVAPAFLAKLNHTLFDRTDRQIRADGAAQSPAHTLASRHGACRDLAVLFMAACQSLGITSRFVSGYQAKHDSKDGRRHLHAWPEAFLPGAGWLGFDPTHGTPVNDGHVALCAAPSQTATMPLEGGFFGTGITSVLTYDVRIATE